MTKEYDECPECRHYVLSTNGKLARHEVGLGYTPYRLYKKLERISGTSVKEQAKKNKCKGSGIIVRTSVPKAK